MSEHSFLKHFNFPSVSTPKIPPALSLALLIGSDKITAQGGIAVGIPLARRDEKMSHILYAAKLLSGWFSSSSFEVTQKIWGVGTKMVGPASSCSDPSAVLHTQKKKDTPSLLSHMWIQCPQKYAPQFTNMPLCEKPLSCKYSTYIIGLTMKQA